MVKIILFIMLFVSGTIGTWAQPVADDDIKQLQKQMYQLYNKNDEEAFIDITNQLKEAAQKVGDERTFYKAWSNQALYFANHQQRNKGHATVCPEPRPQIRHLHWYTCDGYHTEHDGRLSGGYPELP